MNESPKAETVTEVQEQQEPQFEITLPVWNVNNRTSADRIAKILYGPNARVWINRVISAQGDTGVQVGTEKGSDKTFLTSGVDFAEALEGPALAYLLQAQDFNEAKLRVLQLVAAGSSAGAFIKEAYSPFPEGRKFLQDLEQREKAVKELQEKFGQPQASVSAEG